jgi:hypothetical protein
VKAAKSARLGFGMATEVGRKAGGAMPGKSVACGLVRPGTARDESKSEVEGSLPRPKRLLADPPYGLWRSTGDSPPKTRVIVRGVMRVSVT